MSLTKVKNKMSEDPKKNWFLVDIDSVLLFQFAVLKNENIKNVIK